MRAAASIVRHAASYAGHAPVTNEGVIVPSA